MVQDAFEQNKFIHVKHLDQTSTSPDSEQTFNTGYNSWNKTCEKVGIPANKVLLILSEDV